MKKIQMHPIFINLCFMVLLVGMFFSGSNQGKHTMCKELEGQMSINTLNGDKFCLLNTTYINQKQAKYINDQEQMMYGDYGNIKYNYTIESTT